MFSASSKTRDRNAPTNASQISATDLSQIAGASPDSILYRFHNGLNEVVAVGCTEDGRELSLGRKV
jgi:hypothetical protein